VISVGIVDRDELPLFGLRYLLESQPDFVVAFASNSLVDLPDAPLDCLVLDLALIDELAERGRARDAAPLKVIGLAADGPLADRFRLTRPDLAEVQLRDDAARELVGAVRRVTADSSMPSSGAVLRTGVGCLSPREAEVLRYIADGFTHDQAAHRIGISRHTVDTYVKRMKSKLGVSSKVQLVRAAIVGVGY
jgi:two-component system invasion response regulator UvrY